MVISPLAPAMAGLSAGFQLWRTISKFSRQTFGPPREKVAGFHVYLKA